METAWHVFVAGLYFKGSEPTAWDGDSFLFRFMSEYHSYKF